MAWPFDSRYFQFLCLALLCLPAMYAADRITNSTFYFKDFRKDSSDFESHLALYGHAKVVNGTASIEIPSTGRVVCRTPVKLFDGSPRRVLSFSTSFSFSIPSGHGVGLAFFMVPVGFPVDVFDDVGSFGLLSSEMNRTALVQFDTFMNDKRGDLNSNHVRININGSASIKSANLSSLDLKLNEGKKLQAWIDYQAGSKRIEVRLGRLGDIKPIDPLLSYRINLSQVWKEGEMLVGLSSSSTTNSTSNVYSWSFQMRHIPHWMHSEPIDPNTLPEKTKSVTSLPAPPKQKECLFRIMSALLFGTACGAAGASFALFLSTVMRNRRQPVAPAPEEFITKPKVSDQELEYKKLNIVAVVDQQAIKDGKM